MIAVSEDDRDLLDQYLFEVSKTPLLTPPEEIELAKKVRAGAQAAMQELAKRNLRSVISSINLDTAPMAIKILAS